MRGCRAAKLVKSYTWIICKIFKRFYSNRPDKFGEHSGLGLNIVKNLVDLHGGQVIASNNVNKKGAKVEIIFPKLNWYIE